MQIQQQLRVVVAGIFLVVCLGIAIVSASDVSVFRVNLIQNQEIISVEVPNEVNFGEITKGEQTDNFRINITNTGTVGIKVTPTLLDSSEKIFKQTYFQRRTTEPYSRIGSFSINISAPARGDNRSDYIYAKLDLRNYTDDVSAKTNHNTQVKFVAIKQD